MSRARTLNELLSKRALPVDLRLARAYDAGFLEGSGQAPFTALERAVIDAVLWGEESTVQQAIRNLRESIIKAELERAGESEAERRMGR